MSVLWGSDDQIAQRPQVEDRPEPMFKVGQVVVLKNIPATPFRILFVEWFDGWFYGWNKRNAAAESTIRKLSTDEIG